MVETIRCAELRTRLCTRLYSAVGSMWDGDEVVTVADGVYRTVPAAKAAARSWLARGATQFEVRRGSYSAERISDDVYGFVMDVAWQDDDGWAIHGWAGLGGVEWEVETW